MGKLRGTCIIEGCNNLQRHGYRKKDGSYGWNKHCDSHHKKLYHQRYGNSKQGRKYMNFPKVTCETCGFVPEDICQLDYHHMDGNKNNNERENIKVLCANCHRLVHFK